MINRKLDLKQKTRTFGDIPVPECVTWLIVNAYFKIEKDHLYQDVLIAGWVCDIKAD